MKAKLARKSKIRLWVFALAALLAALFLASCSEIMDSNSSKPGKGGGGGRGGREHFAPPISTTLFSVGVTTCFTPPAVITTGDEYCGASPAHLHFSWHLEDREEPRP